MSLESTQEMLLDAKAGKYAVAAFNVENMEMAQAVVWAANELRAPVIIQSTPGTLRYAGLDMFYANVAALAKKASVPVALHLDHGNIFDLTVQAIREGYTSVMIDGSHEAFNKNVALTRRVVAVAKPNGIPVEAELGKLGGKEDDLENVEECYTDPEEAAEFVRLTGVSSLAVAVGTAHGFYKIKPKLDVQRISEIREVVEVPLVLHGASGLTDTDIRECIQNGICKVNFATELRVAYSDAIKEHLAAYPETYDPKKYGEAARENVKKLVAQRIRVCGCNNRV